MPTSYGPLTVSGLKAEATVAGGVMPRRELRTRNAGWARLLARQLARVGVRPNAVSIASVVFAAGAGVCLAISPAAGGGARAALLLAAAALTQLRLLCNLLDGLLAVEQRLATRNGVLYNEIPDRIADVLVLAGGGYAAASSLSWGATLGWGAAALALFTAYVRVLGGSLGVTQTFAGPMAKQHRMFTLTAAAMTSAAEAWFGLPMRAMPLGLLIIIAGSIVTIARRIHGIARELEAQ
jgi:phosphatidylglycerophosphate synthase